MSNINEVKLEMEVTDFLHELGISNSLKGFQYLRYAIIETVKDFKFADSIVDMYSVIANDFDDVASRVERAMRHGISKMVSDDKSDVVHETFKNTIHRKQIPTNSEFITTIADKFRLKYKMLNEISKNENKSVNSLMKTYDFSYDSTTVCYIMVTNAGYVEQIDIKNKSYNEIVCKTVKDGKASLYAIVHKNMNNINSDNNIYIVNVDEFMKRML